jgi:hypothetical protein
LQQHPKTAGLPPRGATIPPFYAGLIGEQAAALGRRCIEVATSPRFQ